MTWTEMRLPSSPTAPKPVALNHSRSPLQAPSLAPGLPPGHRVCTLPALRTPVPDTVPSPGPDHEGHVSAVTLR